VAVVEKILSTLKNGFGMTLKKWRELLFGFGKIYAVSIALLLTLFIIIGGVALVAGSSSLLDLIVIIPIILLALILILLSGGIAMSSNTVVDNAANGKKFEFIKTIKEDLVRNSIYVAVMAVLGIAANMPRIIGQFVEGVAGLFLFAIGLVIELVWIFIIQFSYWEYVVGRKGVIDSIKNSYSAVMKNLGFVLAMDIIVSAITVILAIIFYILLSMVFFGLMIVFLGGGIALTQIEGGATAFPLYDVGVVVAVLLLVGLIAIALIGIIVADVLFKPVAYYTWKEATKKK